MKWVRARQSTREIFGTLEEDRLSVHEGDMFVGATPTGETLALADLAFLPPVRPGKFVGLWNNFHAAAAKNGWAVPAEPLYFLKGANAIAAHQSEIAMPSDDIGRVFYELIARDASFAQWTRAKSFDGFGPLGPVVAVGLDPHSLVVRTRVNGRERQNYPVSDMIFGPASLVERLSRDMTLEPGDVIACGTSLGALPVKAGMLVEVEIDGIGVLANRFVLSGLRADSGLRSSDG